MTPTQRIIASMLRKAGRRVIVIDETKMKLSSHTPGPWTIDGQYPLTEIAAVKSLGFSYRITAAPNGKDEEKEAEANANLISAAPDLLAACKLAVEEIGQSEGCWAALDALREAIHKTEGKS